MAVLEDYFRYTLCTKMPAGRKRLRFIIHSIERFRRKKSPEKIHILDYGCGNGYLTIAIASLGYNIDGVDVDKASIEFATQKNPFGNAKFYYINEGESSILDINRSKEYDIVLSSYVLRWTKDPYQYLHSARKCLKPNGILILIEENPFGPREILGDFEYLLLKSKIFRGVINFARNKLGMTSIEDRTKLYNVNPDILQIQLANRKKFSIYCIRKLFSNEGFEILEEHNSFFIFAVFGLRKNGILDEWDCKLADYLPRFMVSGWHFILQHKQEITQGTI